MLIITKPFSKVGHACELLLAFYTDNTQYKNVKRCRYVGIFIMDTP